MIDTSGSIGSSNFQLIREFTANITIEIIRNSPRTAVGVILLDSSAHIEFNLQAYENLNSLLSAINQLPYTGGGTDTAEALTLLLSTAQNGTLGLRSDSSKVAIVITDGHSNSQSATISAAAALHASNIFDVYAVGVGGADLTELENIASSPDFVFFASYFNSTSLQQLKKNLLQQLCKCKWLVGTSNLILCTSSYIIYSFINLASLLSITLQPSGYYQNTVGQRQDVICSVSVPPDVDPDTVELAWLNEDDIITDDSRIIINKSIDYINGSNLVTIIQFDPLSEEDEGEYICYVIINGSYIFESINLQNFISK